MKLRVTGPTLPVQTCARRLAALLGTEHTSVGSRKTREDLGLDETVLTLDDGSGASHRVLACEISWHGPHVAEELPGSEPVVQAISGLAHLHGLDRGWPRPLGVELGSVAAGVLASQGVLAALLGRRRGAMVSTVRTSVTQAALCAISQYIARATSSDTWSEWMPMAPGPEPGPPFRSADGYWFEIEALETETWKCFWSSLGVQASLLGRAWTMFHARYSTAICTLPRGFHGATQGRTLAELAELARRCGVSLSVLRSYPEVVAEPGLEDTEFPVIREHTGPTDRGSAAVEQFPAAATGASADLPLAGLRVVEATSRIQGPLAGQFLRMLGAEVIRVEPPGGDPARGAPPLSGDTGAVFLCMNRGKKSVELDLAQPAGRAELVDLVADADVFLHNWRPGKAVEWHLDFADLAPHNPKLVYGAASGWGEFASRCPPIGVEFLVQAYTGLGNAIHPEGEPPLTTRLLVTDFMGAMVACEGILAGLYRRECGAGASKVDTSLLAGAMSLHSHALAAYASGTEYRRRSGRPVWTSWDTPLQAADGLILVTVSDEAALNRLSEICGADTQCGSRGALESSITRRLANRPAREWQQVLPAAGIPCGAVRSDLSELPADPLLGSYMESVGDTWAPSGPWRFTSNEH